MGERRRWGRLSNCLHVNFKLNSPCPGTIYTLNANQFLLLLLSCVFAGLLTVDGKMLINVRMESFLIGVTPLGLS